MKKHTIYKIYRCVECGTMFHIPYPMKEDCKFCVMGCGSTLTEGTIPEYEKWFEKLRKGD